MTTVDISAVRSLPHVDANLDLGGRIFPLHAFRDRQRSWHEWLPKENKLIKLYNATPVEGLYFSERAASKWDLRLFFFEFTHQRALWPDIESSVSSALSDLFLMGASLRKVRLLFTRRRELSGGASRMVAGELEYLFILCMSMYDLLQATMVKLWRRSHLRDLPKPQRLPRSFRKIVVNKDGTVRTIEQIMSRFRLPEAFAEAYLEHADFFVWLRDYRDKISHQGRAFDLVFETERGFAVATNKEPFRSMDIWCSENTVENGLGSLRSVACHLCYNTLVALDTMMYRYAQIIQSPSPVAPDCGVFVRGPTLRDLVFVEQGVKDDPWL